MNQPSTSTSEPSLLRGLSEQQQVLLTDLLDRYLRLLEEGENPDRQSLVPPDANLSPELRQALDLYLDKLGELYQLVDGRPADIGSDLRGKQLGDYRLQEEIGRGGMGIVFTAYDASLKRKVAVKLLPMAAMLEPKYIDRFRGEAQAAASLEHPNIVPVYSVGEESGINYYAMRLIDGQSLDQRIRMHAENCTHPPSNSALLQFADIADALHEVHEYGIVHRDIKPSNLLLDSTGKLWVADFGLARFQSDAALTRTGEMIGTMRYMSPEQALGRSELVDHRSDIYSLGATLYELLTGQPAVPGEEGPGLLKTLATHSPARLNKLRPDLPSDFQVILEKAMARHRDDRYASASEFACDLRKAARGEIVTTKLVSPAVLASRWVSQHPRAVSVLIASAAMFALLVTTGFYMYNRLLSDALNKAYSEVVSLQALETDETIDALAMIPGAEGVRQSLIAKHLEHYRSFVEQPLVDPNMREARANALYRLGSFSEEIGQIPEGILYYQRAEELYREIVPSDHFFDSRWKRRSENLNRLALALRRVGQYEKGGDLLNGWLESIAKSSAKSLPLVAREQYALAQNNLGLMLEKQTGKQALAEATLRSALTKLRALQAEEPQRVSTKRALAATKRNLGSLLAKRDKSAAREFLSSALQDQIELAKSSDSPLRASIDLVATYISMGNLFLDQEPGRAALAFQNSVEIGRKLVEISPKVDDYRRDLAVSLSNLGMALYRTGQIEEAQSILKEAVHRYRILHSNHPDHPGIRHSLGIALNNQGIVLQHVGQPSAAEESYSRAAKLLEEAEPVQVEALDNVYTNHLRMLRQEGKHEEAHELSERQSALRLKN